MGAIVDLDTSDLSTVRHAADLLAQSVHESISGLVPYHAPGFTHYLKAALEPPAELRTVLVRVVVVNGTLVGAADWRVLPDELFLNGIAVVEAARGMGLGKRLMLDGVGIAKELGRTGIGLDVFLDNVVGMSFYRRLEFVAVRETKWYDIGADVGADARSLAVAVNWPSFRADVAAYGFGDLTLRDETGVLARLRQVGRNLRIDPVVERACALAYSKLLGTTRVFRAVPQGAAKDRTPFALSARMQLEL